MDVGPKRDLLGLNKSFLSIHGIHDNIIELFQVILLLPFEIVQILSLVYIIRCTNGFIHCTCKISKITLPRNISQA